MKELQVESSQTASENDPSKDPFLLKLAKITGIGEEVLRDPLAIRRTSVAQRMSCGTAIDYSKRGYCLRLDGSV